MRLRYSKCHGAGVTIRGRIEAGFESWGRGVVGNPWIAIGVLIVLTGLMGSFLPGLRVDNSTEAFLHLDDPDRLRFDRFRKQFDDGPRVAVIVRPREIFDLEFLGRLESLHRDLETKVPYVEEVTSLINARNSRGEGEEFIVEELMEDWPHGDDELAALRARVLSNPLYVGTLISENADYTLLSIKPYTYSTLHPQHGVLSGFDDSWEGDEGEAEYLTDAETRELVAAVHRVAKRHDTADLLIHVSGGPVLDFALMQTLQRDVFVFLPLSILLIAGVLAILFRTLSGVVLPLVVVLSSLVSTMGVMVLLDIPFSITLNFLPAFLLVVGISDSVHILVIVYQRLATGRAKQEAITDALGHSGLAVVMTSATTAAGLASFSVAELAPVAQLGVIAPIGVLLAMVYSLVLLPALLALTPLGAGRRRVDAQHDFSVRMLAKVADVATGHPVAVLVAAAAMLVLGLGGVLRVHFSHDGIRWFPADDPVRLAAELVDREFDGAARFEVLVHTGREDGLQEPDTLRRIEEAMRFSETTRVGEHRVKKAISLVDIVKETHRALNENRPEFYVLPEDRGLVAQELLLFENSGSDDLDDFTDTQFRTARLTIRTPIVDGMLYREFFGQVQAGLREILGDGLEFEFTGGVVLMSRVFRAVIISMARSYVFALVVIAPMLVLLVGDLRRGLAALIPNLIPVYLILALMGWAGIPLDASTLLIGGILIGLAVDDTIHFMHKFNRYLEQTGDARRAVHETLVTTGSALFFTSVILSLGTAVFMLSYMNNTVWFGLLASCSIVIAFIADVTVAPALMILLSRRHSRGA